MMVSRQHYLYPKAVLLPEVDPKLVVVAREVSVKVELAVVEVSVAKVLLGEAEVVY